MREIFRVAFFFFYSLGQKLQKKKKERLESEENWEFVDSKRFSAFNAEYKWN